MPVDREWFKRNLGYDPITERLPDTTFSTITKVEHATPEDFQREIIDFDSESDAGTILFTYSRATGLSRYKDIPWPAGLEPQTAGQAGGDEGGPLPEADVLLVTWTVDEGHALSRVITPGKDSRNDYLPYTHNYDTLSDDFRDGCPAKKAGRLGAYWMTTINGKSVVVFKSESHMSQDGPKLPNIKVWKQIINEVKPKLVITTGTAGGIGADCEIGDVAVGPLVAFDCTAKFKSEPFAKDSYTSDAPNTKHFQKAMELFAINASQLPPDNTRPPKILIGKAADPSTAVLTTDFFGFDTTEDHFHLQGHGLVSEMGDAVMGLVSKEMGDKAPRWIAVRNVSDPQIGNEELDIHQRGDMAAHLYMAYGRWSSVCSAIVCWALIAAE